MFSLSRALRLAEAMVAELFLFARNFSDASNDGFVCCHSFCAVLTLEVHQGSRVG